MSAIGELFTCLFATSGFDLRSLLRAGYDDQVIAERIGNIWQARHDRYSELRLSANQVGHQKAVPSKVEMSYIGG